MALAGEVLPRMNGRRRVAAVVLATFGGLALALLRDQQPVPSHPQRVFLLPIFLITGTALFSLRYQQVYLTWLRALGAGATFTASLAVLAGLAFGALLLARHQAVATLSDVDWEFTLACAGIASSAGITVGLAAMAALVQIDNNLVSAKTSRAKVLSLIDELDAPRRNVEVIHKELIREVGTLIDFGRKAMSRLPSAEQSIIDNWINSAGKVGEFVDRLPLGALIAPEAKEGLRLSALPLRSYRA